MLPKNFGVTIVFCSDMLYKKGGFNDEKKNWKED